MFDFLDEDEILDRDEEKDLTLFRYINQVVETAVLVKHYGKPNEETLILASPLADYPTTLEEAAGYKWVTEDEKDWSKEGWF